MPTRVQALLSLVVMALLTTCRGREGTGPAAHIPTDIAPVSGDHQTGTVGQVLAQPLVAKVTSSTGAGVAGVTVTWQLTAGGGALSTSSVPTDSQGRASVGVTLGTTSGSNNTIVTASVAGLSGSPVTFTASGTAGPVSQLAAVAGSLQTGTVGQAAPESLVVEVVDQFGNPVTGAIVTWAVTAGGGSVSAPSVATDALGRAAVAWTLGSLVGTQRATAAVANLAGPPLEFVATALTGAAAQIVLVSGNAQSDIVGTPLADPYVVRVTDAFGNPVAGVGIIWGVTSGGGSITPLAALTNASGLDSAIRTLGTVAGLNLDTATATVPGLIGSPIVFAATANPGLVSQLSAVSGDNQSGTVGLPVGESLVVQARDQYDNAVLGALVGWSVTTGGGTLSATSTPTDAQGHASARWTLGDTAGPQSAAATFGGAAGSPVPFAATALAGPPSSLSFTQPPGNTAAGAVMDPAVTVAIVDAFGNLVVSATNLVGVALASNPAGGTLSGTTPVAAVNGVATFADLSIDQAGTGYSLQASAGALTPVTSPAFNVTAIGVPVLAFTVQPVTTQAGAAIAPAVQVTAQDALGNTVSGFTGDVTIAIGSNPGGATLSGTTTETAVAGVATFSNLQLDKTGIGYTLTATSHALGGAASTGFDVTAGPVSASLSTLKALPNTIVASAGGSGSTITVTARDLFDNPIPSATVVLAASGSGNTLTQPATTNTNGVTTGSLRAITVGPKIVSATVNGVPITQTDTVTVTAGVADTLAFTGQPTNTTAGVSINAGAGGVVVTARDSFGNTATGFTGDVTMAIGSNPGGGILSGTLSRPAVAGVTTFSDLTIAKTGTDYSLSATSGSLTGAVSGPFNITPAPVSPTQSTLVAQPGSIGASSGGTTATLTVTAKDSLGNLIPGVTVVFSVTGSGNTVTQPATTTNASGVATGTLSATAAGAKIVSATGNAVAITQRDTVTVTPGTAASLVFTGQPTNVAAGATINGGSGGVVVTARDSFANTATGFSGSVSMAIATNPAGGTLSGTLSRTAVAGIATFSNLSIDQPGTGYTLQTTSGGLTPAPSATFNITGSGSVVVSAGNGQTGLVGFALNVAPSVLVRDAANVPVANAQVTFAVTGGGGGVSGANATTNVNGIATVGSWTVQLGVNTLTATVAASGLTGNPVTFTATGAQAAYDIDVRFLTPMSPSRQAAFTNAAARWAALIFGNVPNIMVNLPAGSCGPNSPALNETIDDIVIFATVDSIDGPDNVLGQAGPCFIRSSGKLPLLGAMIFDSADVAQLELDGQFELVIMHEMGHVLGYGTIWTDLGLLVGGGDPHLVGPQAIAAFNNAGGQGYVGAKVPVEDCCGPGTRNAHWRESVLAHELMTGFLDAGANPLSVISTASMGDLGYVVNYAASDPYTVANPVAAIGARPRPQRPLPHDILRVPLVELDAAGRVVLVHPLR